MAKLVLTPSELAELDATWRQPPAFEAWPTRLPSGDAWDAALSSLGELRDRAVPKQLENAVSIALRAAAFETGLIEGLYQADRGLTLTVATHATVWQHDVESQAGSEALPLFEAQLRGYELLLDTVTEKYPITEAWIRALHETLTAPQATYPVIDALGNEDNRPLPRGAYKSEPNHVRTANGSLHAYAPVGETDRQMARLVAELRTDRFAEAHPVLQASYAHYCLASIHPFADGNGRVGRAVGSVFTYRAARVPLLIFADERELYFDALEAADEQDAGPFVQMVYDATMGALSLVIENLRAAVSPSPSRQIERLATLLSAQGGLSHAEIDAAAHRLIAAFAHAMRESVGSHAYPTGVAPSVSDGSGGPAPSPPDGYRPTVSDVRFATLTVSAAAPASALVNARFDVYVGTDFDERDVFWLIEPGTNFGARFPLRDVEPAISIGAQLRLKALAERALGIALDQLTGLADESFRQSGYDRRP